MFTLMTTVDGENSALVNLTDLHFSDLEISII